MRRRRQRKRSPQTRTGIGPNHQEGEGFEQPMTEGFQIVLAASDEERRDLFVGAAERLRTNERINNA